MATEKLDPRAALAKMDAEAAAEKIAKEANDKKNAELRETWLKELRETGV